MAVSVFILGTLHSIQWGRNPDQQSVEAFKQKVLDICRTKKIRLIAEEMSLEALTKQGIDGSVAASLGKQLDLQHRYCDPNSSERARLGIDEDNEIRLKGFLMNWSDDQVQKRISDEYEKRELVWLHKLKIENIWPTLFICGSDHSGRFQDILQVAGIECEVV